jgi:hypothetical protein
MPHRQLHRKRERQVRGELGQPFTFFRRLADSPPDPGHAGGQVVTKPIDVVISPVRGNLIDSKTGPLWELRCQQPTNELDVGLDLIGMHLCGAHPRHH